MQPVELDAGGYRLRPLRATDAARIRSGFDDEPMRRFVAAFQLPDLNAAVAYVARRSAEWDSGRRCSWAVTEASGDTLLAEIGLNGIVLADRRADISCWTHADQRRRGLLATVLPAVLRFGFDTLGLHRIGYWHAASNTASARLAQRCGFTLDGRLRGAAWVNGTAEDMVVWSRLSTDRPAGRPG